MYEFSFIDFGLVILILPLIAMVLLQVSKLTKIPPILVFIFVGLLLGETGIVNIFNSEVVAGPLDWFTSNVSLLVLFIMAGFSMQITQMLKSGGEVVRQSALPITVATIGGGIVLYFVANLIGINFEVSVYSMIIFAAATALMMLPVAIPTLLSQSKPTQNNVSPILIGGGSLENVTVIPLVLITMVIASGLDSVMDLVISLVLTIVVTMLVFLLGLVVGKLFGKAAYKLSNNELAYAALFTAVVAIVVFFSGPLQGLGIITALIAGMYLRSSVNPKHIPAVQGAISKIFALYVLPSLFLGVGAKMDWHIFLDFKVILFILIVLLVLGSLRAITTLLILPKLNEGEKQIAAISMFIFGSGAINLSVVVSAYFDTIGASGTDELMAYTGTVLYIICTLIAEFILKPRQEAAIANGA